MGEVGAKEFGELRGETRSEIKALHEKVDIQGKNLDDKITKMGKDQTGGFKTINTSLGQIGSRLTALEQRNGWRGGVRTAGWGGGGVGLLLAAAKLLGLV